MFSAHVLQNVHSKVQITASLLDGGRSLLQHSQFGLSSNISHSFTTHNVSRNRAPKGADAERSGADLGDPCLRVCYEFLNSLFGK